MFCEFDLVDLDNILAGMEVVGKFQLQGSCNLVDIAQERHFLLRNTFQQGRFVDLSMHLRKNSLEYMKVLRLILADNISLLHMEFLNRRRQYRYSALHKEDHPLILIFPLCCNHSRQDMLYSWLRRIQVDWRR